MALLLASHQTSCEVCAASAEENIHELADKATQVLDQTVDKGREFIKDRQAVLSDAVEPGRAAIEQDRERLSGKKKA